MLCKEINQLCSKSYYSNHNNTNLLIINRSQENASPLHTRRFYWVSAINHVEDEEKGMGQCSFFSVNHHPNVVLIAPPCLFSTFRRRRKTVLLLFLLVLSSKLSAHSGQTSIEFISRAAKPGMFLPCAVGCPPLFFIIIVDYSHQVTCLDDSSWRYFSLVENIALISWSNFTS